MSKSKTEYQIVPATLAHAEELAKNIREVDRQEIWAAGRRLPLESLVSGIRVSREPMAGLADGKVMCIFGVAVPTLLSDIGCPWMLGATGLSQHSKALLLLSRPYAAKLRTEYRLLLNYVDARNKSAVRWLKWLGFEIKEPIPFGPDQLPFYPFEMKRED